MNIELLILGIVIIICLIFNKYLDKIGVPALLFFLFLGMVFGEDGPVGIVFNDYALAEVVCSISLIFIMFYGGFNTNIKTARPIILSSLLLSSLGVVFTTGLVALFLHYVLKLPLLEGLLVGAIISSTDAASVFNILKVKKLSLKYHTDSLLEMESGSNDPIAYTLTIVFLSLLKGEEVAIGLLLFKQIFIGLLFGYIAAKMILKFVNTDLIESEENKTLLLFAFAITSYSLCYLLDGNGYLSVYLCGIIVGNAKIIDKSYLSHFFSSLSDIAQVIIFFLLGLLVTPSELPEVLLPSFILVLFLTFIARPLAISSILVFFKTNLRQLLVVSAAGLRGAASIVFSILAILSGVSLRYDIFNLVFCLVLFSIALQGTFLPLIAKRAAMIDDTHDITKTFNDYEETTDINFIKTKITKDHYWNQRLIKDIMNFNDLLIVMIIRKNEIVIPDGDTQVIEGDILVMAGHEFEDRDDFSLNEIVIDKNHKWLNKKISDIKLKANSLIVMIQNGNDSVIPSGNTIIKENDILVMFAKNRTSNLK